VSNELHLLSCDDEACSGSSDLLIAGDSLFVQDLAVGIAAGRPVIAYVATYDRPKAAQDDVDYVLRLAVCADAACSTWDDRIVDDPDPLVDISVVSVAMTVDATGRPLIVYGGDNFGLRFLACDDSTCATGTTRDIASDYPSDYGMMPAITLDPDGLPVIAYLRGVLDPVIGNLQERTNPVIARCHDATCASITKATVGEALRWYVPAIVVPADDRPVVFWTAIGAGSDYGGGLDYRLMAARCDDPSCATSSQTVIDDTPVLEPDGSPTTWSVAGFDPSASLGPDGLPRVAYLAWRQFVPADWQPWAVVPWKVVVAACSEPSCATVRRGYVDEWSRIGGWYHRAVMVPAATRADGTLVLAFGSFPRRLHLDQPGARRDQGGDLRPGSAEPRQTWSVNSTVRRRRSRRRPPRPARRP
jgi:hypothetical protein